MIKNWSGSCDVCLAIILPKFISLTTHGHILLWCLSVLPSWQTPNEPPPQAALRHFLNVEGPVMAHCFVEALKRQKSVSVVVVVIVVIIVMPYSMVLNSIFAEGYFAAFCKNGRFGKFFKGIIRFIFFINKFVWFFSPCSVKTLDSW